MSEPLSKKLGISPIEEGTIVSGLMNGRECDAYIEGHNRAVRKLDQLSPDVVKLAKVLFDLGIKIVGFTSTGWEDLSAREKIPYLGEAQEIINKMSEWIVKKGK